MKKVSVTEAKNGLSRLFIEVGRRESVLIINRGTPVARIEPYYTNRLGHDQAAADLIRRGIADPPAEPCDVEHLLGTPSPSLPEGVSAREAGAAAGGDPLGAGSGIPPGGGGAGGGTRGIAAPGSR